MLKHLTFDEYTLSTWKIQQSTNSIWAESLSKLCIKSRDFIQNLDNDSTQIELVDCSIFQVDSVYSSNVSCFNNSDGYA